MLLSKQRKGDKDYEVFEIEKELILTTANFNFERFDINNLILSF